MKIGLFFGSFNPIHIGHLVIAEHMASFSDLDEVWFVVTPHNPHKKKNSLANNYERLHLVELAIADNPKLRASNIEFGLPQPSYTVDTLAYLQERHPNHDFVLIMGGDNLLSLPKWKNHEWLLEHHNIYVYQRPNYAAAPLATHPNVTLFDAPQMDISASFIRKSIQAGKSVRYLLPTPVFNSIEKTGLYQ